MSESTCSWPILNFATSLGMRFHKAQYLVGPLLCLVYINDLLENLGSIVKLFAGNASLFSTVHNPFLPAEIINNDLIKISEKAYQWEMSLNSDPTKQAQEVIFSRKLKKRVRPKKFFDDGLVVHSNYQKHLGMYLDVLYQRKNFESYQRHWSKFGN